MNRRDLLKSLSAVAAASPFALRGSSSAQSPTENCVPPLPELWSQPGTPWVPEPGTPTRVRKSVTDLMKPENAKELANLREAYRRMRALDPPADKFTGVVTPTDPRSLVAQAHVHCYYCTGTFGFPAPVDIHGAWFFFPWHRMFLYFHERILGSLINDPTLALPYWDWDNPSRRFFPEAYSGDDSNPLFDDVREATPTSEPKLDYWFSFLKIDVGADVRDSSAQDFLGSPHDFFNYNGGQIEKTVHGKVHIWTGQPGMQNGDNGVPDMGVLQTAGRDPSFYIHHANIDRLMEMWSKYPNPPVSHAYPSTNAFLEQRFSFFDIQKEAPFYRWVSISVRDVLDLQRLSYRFDSIAPPPPEPKRPAPIRGTSTAAAVPNPTTRGIELPERLTDGAVPGARLKLRLEGVHMTGGGTVRVFINLPNADARSSSDLPNYVGFFSRVSPSVANSHAHRPLNISIDVTDELPALQKGRAALTVSLVPISRPSAPPRIGNARIVIE